MNLRFAVLALAAVSLRPALAVDPSRTLTQYFHRVWQAQQGLPEGTIYAIFQTHDGYLWLGSQTGLIRFDGVRFEKFADFDHGAHTTAWTRYALEDASHALWIGTQDAGLFHVEGDSDRHFLEKESIQCLSMARNGDIWACTQNGIARIKNGILTRYASQQGMAENNTRAVCESSSGAIHVASGARSLNVFDGEQFTSRTLDNLPADATIRAMECSGSAIWIGSDEGLLRLEGGVQRLYTMKNGLPDNRILSLTRGRDGSLWIGTRNGFSRMRGEEIESYRPAEGLSQSTVYSIFEDAEGSLWVGTKNGLNQFLSGRALPYTANEGLPSNETGPILEDASGAIWIGTLDAGLARYDGKRFHKQQGLSSSTIYGLANGAGGELWVGTAAGVDLLKEGRVIAHYRSPAVRSLFLDGRSVLWAGTDKGPAKLENGGFSPPAHLPAELRVPIAAIAGDDSGRIYFAAEHEGLYVYENGSAHPVLDHGAPLREVDALYSGADGRLWIGTAGFGLKLLDGAHVTSVLIRDGMFDNEIYGIVADAQDRLWMSCSKGLFSVPRADLLRFASGASKRVASTPYSPTDANRTIECRSGVQPASFRMRDGRLWFSTIRGAYVFDPAHLTFNIPAPPVVIEATTVNGERFAPDQIGGIAPGVKNLEFTYTGLTFIQPARVTFRYILEGFDKKWVEAGTRREAFYTNLPPGTYTFRVSACNADGICSPAAATETFSLAPHFYQRSWFVPLCILALALVAWTVYRMRIHRLREQFNLILTERSRIARELHDTLIQGLSGITMEMQALAGRLRSPEERATLEEIVRDAGTCLRETRRSVAGLRSAGHGLASAIAEEARRITEAKDVRLKLKLGAGPSDLSPEAQYNILRIASEAMNNAVKHSGAKSIEVALDSNAEHMRLSVRDDGSGFSRDNGNARPGHYGLIGMRERAAQIGAELRVDSEPGRGTTISVLLPAGSRQTVGVHIT